MRKRGRTDANQSEIVEALRKAGAIVWITSGCGKGAPDLIVGFNGRTFMVEIKDGNKPPSARTLTDDEFGFHAAWKAHGVIVWIVKSTEEALQLLAEK